MSRRRRRRGAEGPTGILLVDKPGGVTSHDVVNRIRRSAGQRRVGHAGTLDPLATGLLPLLLGEATKLSPFATADDKAYRTTARLGIRTDSLDADGQEVSRSAVDPGLDAATVTQALQRFAGEIEQRVPKFSAVKVDGKRLYKSARQGEDVELPTRQVVIHDTTLLDVTLPDVTFEVSCSKGTYIRQLVADLGDALGPGAHVTALRRLRVGALDVADATPLEALQGPQEIATALISPQTWAAGSMACVRCDEGAIRRTRMGQILPWASLAHDPLPPTTRFALVTDTELVAVAQTADDPEHQYRLLRVFVGQPSPD